MLYRIEFCKYTAGIVSLVLLDGTSLFRSSVTNLVEAVLNQLALLEIIDSVLVPLGGGEKFVVAAALANLIGDSGVARLNRIDYLHTRHTSLVGNALDGRLKGSNTRLNLADGAIKVR